MAISIQKVMINTFISKKILISQNTKLEITETEMAIGTKTSLRINSSLEESSKEIHKN